jgi:hypothetical protein
MAELGRAQPVIVAFIATILTANIAFLSTERAQAERAVALTMPSPTQQSAQPAGFILFGKSDTAVAIPTVFGVRVDSTQLTPSSRPPVRTDKRSQQRVGWSHDGTLIAAIRQGETGDDLWLFAVRGGTPRRLTHFSSVETSFCGRSGVAAPQLRRPMFSPDDRHIAFLSNANHLNTFGFSFDVDVVDVAGGNVVTAYRAPADTCERISATASMMRPTEFVSLLGWVKSVNMAA